MHYEWAGDGYGYGGESLWEKGVFSPGVVALFRCPLSWGRVVASPGLSHQSKCMQ